MRVGVIGCGAVGSLFAAHLAQLDDVEVWAYDLHEGHVRAINEHDLKLSGAGRVWVIEANPNPQLSYDEDFAQSAKKSGIVYGDLIQRIVNLGLRWEPTRLG